MVHPTRSDHFKFLASEADYTGGRQARYGNIVRDAARSLRFLADAAFTVNHRKFFRVQRQAQLKTLIDRFQLLVAPLPLNLPIAVPDAAELFVHRREARTGSIDTFRVIKLPAIQIAQSEMRDVEITYLPSCDPGGNAADCLP